jgi:hydroxymethylpyrimidine/phosphomethylpyrimidine kinase
VVLCVGGLDPAGRAGLLADVRAVEAMGGRALAVPTALTHQTSHRAEGFEPVEPSVVARQVAMLLSDERVGAVKVGQLASLAHAQALAPLFAGRTLVLDTPLATSTGIELVAGDERDEAYGRLMPLATLVTPNRPEWTLLKRAGETDGRAMQRLGVRQLLLKGGHGTEASAEDVFWTLRGDGAVEARRYAAPRIAGRFRGTGCRLASAIAARLAAGAAIETAIDEAKNWLTLALRAEAA